MRLHPPDADTRDPLKPALGTDRRSAPMSPWLRHAAPALAHVILGACHDEPGLLNTEGDLDIALTYPAIPECLEDDLLEGSDLTDT